MRLFNLLTVAGALLVPALASAQNIIATDDFESYAYQADPLGEWKQRRFLFSDAGCVTFDSAVPGFDQGAEPMKDFFGFQYYNIGGLDLSSYMGGEKNLIVADQDQDLSAACHQTRAQLEFVSGSTDLGEGKIVDYTLSMAVKDNKDTTYPNDASSKFAIYLGYYAVPSYAAIKETFLPIDLSAGTVTLTDSALDLTNYDNILVVAGMYAQADDTKQAVGNFDNFIVSWQENGDAAVAEEAAACADTSVLRFEDGFGGSDVTCRTDTYSIPADAYWWAGFGDSTRGDQYPFYFPEGGSITFDCQTESGTQGVYFRFEEQADSTGTLVQEKETTSTAQCTATGSRASVTVDVPASETVWNNLVMYLDTGITSGKTESDGPATVVENITVNGSQEYVAPVPPIPALPIWGLLGLTGLVGVMGMRRRRKQ